MGWACRWNGVEKNAHGRWVGKAFNKRAARRYERDDRITFNSLKPSGNYKYQLL
jgi:hypothetical protein